MSPWRAVPVEATVAMSDAGKYTLKGAADEFERTQALMVFKSMLAAAPAFEPTPAMRDRAIRAFYDPAHKTSDQRMRAALIAAFSTKE